MRYSLIPAAIPALALVVGLPFVNRLQPVVLGLPFLLVWILGWVLVTPAFLAAAYLLEARRRTHAGPDPDAAFEDGSTPGSRGRR